MERTRVRVLALAFGPLAAALALGAATPTPSYDSVVKRIEAIEKGWKSLTPLQNPHGEGWSRFFQEVRTELDRYANSADAEQRVQALNRLYKMANSLSNSRWLAAVELREDLRAWVAPRAALAW